MLLKIPKGWVIIDIEDVRRGDLLLGRNGDPFYVKASYAQENDYVYTLADAEGNFATATVGDRVLKKVFDE
jgi:hypothetical protein